MKRVTILSTWMVTTVLVAAWPSVAAAGVLVAD
jgi:hypothetical protein